MHPYGVLAIFAINEHLDILLDGPAQPRAATASKPSRRSRVLAAIKSYRAPEFEGVARGLMPLPR